MDGKLEISRLYDFYGALIPASQQQVVELYVNDDLSLSEVADILSISRQGVRDSLNRAMTKLRSFEEKLGLMAAFDRRSAIAGAIARDARAVISASGDSGIIRLCESILAHAEQLEDNNT
jgi:hypothetical protein